MVHHRAKIVIDDPHHPDAPHRRAPLVSSEEQQRYDRFVVRVRWTSRILTAAALGGTALFFLCLAIEALA